MDLRRREEKSLIYNTSFLGEYECSSLALDRRREEIEDEIGSLETRLNYVRRTAVFIDRKIQRSLVAVLVGPDISGGRLDTKGAATRLTLSFLSFCGEGKRAEIGEAWFGGVRTRGMGRDGLKVVMESMEKVELESRSWLHDGDLFQEVEKFRKVDLPFAPYLDCWKVVKVSSRSLEEGLNKTLMNKKKRSGEDEESKGCCGLNKGRYEERWKSMALSEKGARSGLSKLRNASLKL
ncbi:hypothetical protein Tco_1358216 [Tanacetum coccineum]